LQTYQVLNQVALLTVSQPQTHAFVVVVYYGIEIGEAAVMIKAVFEMRGYSADRRCAIAVIGSAIRLKAVHTNFARCMQVPAGFSPQRFHVAVVASGFAAEEFIPARSGFLIEWYCRVRCRNRELEQLQGGQFRGDEIVVWIDVWQV